MTAPTITRWIYDFDEGSRDMRHLLGGKGANVAEMTRVLGPELVPGGFTITTEACVAYMRAGRVVPEGVDTAIDEALGRLERDAGRRMGDPSDPLLVSVRSGAREPRGRRGRSSSPAAKGWPTGPAPAEGALAHRRRLPIIGDEAHSSVVRHPVLRDRAAD